MVITSRPRKMVIRQGSDVAEMTTGTVISRENGLVSPPVRNKRPASCMASKVMITSAAWGRSR
jgi:hypothetical protein